MITDDVITVPEYEHALLRWLKDEQLSLKLQANYANLRASLQLFEDSHGLLRLKGRFANSALEYERQHPIILRGRDSCFTHLVILNAHQSVMYHGIEKTLAYVRRNYWIVRGRKTIKDILRKCVTCTKYQGVTAKPLLLPDLPDYRVNYLTHAFQATGLDFAGPLFVKEGSKKTKAYILLLTCASSRAIHLELVPDMSVSSFLRGFKRFMARRGVPDVIVNDNFKTFEAVEVTRFMVSHGITQRFILPVSPW